MASDQTSIPVEEQNKVQSEVALSLLGIPRAEIALGIFADVNTYDVNPSEWSMKPAYHVSGDGIKHLPTEAGALVEASRNKVSVLTSKRFFRYQPGRVSAATFGIKSSVSEAHFAQNPVIRKYGIYDKYDGYYWETRNSGEEDNFTVVRRTQSLQYCPTSPYGVKAVDGANSTPLRGENATTKVPATQIDDYRMVGLGDGEKEEFVGELLADRKLLQENRYEFVDAVLARVVANYTASGTVNNPGTNQGTYTATGNYYQDLALAFNAKTGWDLERAVLIADNGNSEVGLANDGYLVTAAQMEAKCKRDLDYWIDNYLLDMKFGGNAHTRWNTTNFALGTNTAGGWESQSVGVFPDITTFEKLVHTEIHNAINYEGVRVSYPSGNLVSELPNGLVLSAAGKTKLVGAHASPATADTGLVDITLAAFNTDDFAPQLSNIDYGSVKDPLDTFFDAKRNFWSYYVTTKKETVSPNGGNTTTPATPLISGKKYTIVNLGAHAQVSLKWNALGALGTTPFVGQVFVANDNAAFQTAMGLIPGTPTSIALGNEAKVAQQIEYSAPQHGPSSDSAASGLIPFQELYLGTGATADVAIQDIIKNKCQRDVGYIIDGYKNDVIGGGDAETTYNASMFVRGTGLSVYSQVESDGSLSEPDRHTYLKNILQNEFALLANSYTANFPGHNLTDVRTKLGSLGDLVVSNFNEENKKTCTIGKRGFPGNLVALRDGLTHVHAGVYDPSLLKDSEYTKVIVTGGDLTTTPIKPSTFKLVKGAVTFNQHVRVTWSGGAADEELFIENAGAKIKKGEILRVTRVLGPKGNEFTLLKENDTRTPVVLGDSAAQTGSITTRTFYIDTVVPFVFPKDYDIGGTIGSEVYKSEIDVTYQTILNDASTDQGPTGADTTTQRQIRSFGDTFGTGAVPKGAMFPYQYATGDDLLSDDVMQGEEYIGFINTALDPQRSLNDIANGNVNLIRSQMDNVNFYPEYVNWIKNNVKPEYWGVYEYRVPRSRFSHDPLDGIKSNATGKSALTPGRRNRVFSDLATSNDGTTARPGKNFVETVGVAEYQNSLYNFDFTKVTMLKIEFSWYGAVGALFLAYIPVGNGEARWVRVHHLRASNQLKIASLGNATLPITYTTYGGGDEQSLGDTEETGADATQHGYNTVSHNIVKYGASYYIDGGDRGTVRLYSHNNQATVSARGKQFAVAGSQSVSNTAQIPGEGVSTSYLIPSEVFIDRTLDGTVSKIGTAGVFETTGTRPAVGEKIRISGTNTGNGVVTNGDYLVSNLGTGGNDDQFTVTELGGSALSGNTGGTLTGLVFQVIEDINPTFYMGAKVQTDSALDQNIKVVWAEPVRGSVNTQSKVFLSAPLNSYTGIKLLPDRSETVYGVETKKTIKSTREGNIVRNRVQVYPTKMSTANIGDDTVRLRFKKTPIFQTNFIVDETTNSDNGLQLSADYTLVNTNAPLSVTGGDDYISNGEDIYGWFRGRVGSSGVTVFGRLYKESDQYYFELLESFEGVVTLISGGRFLADNRFQADGKVYSGATVTKQTEEKEGLSSVLIASDIIVPIAETGVNVATTYLKSGTEQFDLSAYFDYNKEYLSFPLTDIADTLYFAVDSDTASTNTDEISLGVTWEEQ